MRKARKIAFEHELHKTLEKISALPEYMQEILLQDINTAIENRITIMEMVSRKVTGKPA
jgi:ABC-type arginine/histidine transport system permease subunit